MRYIKLKRFYDPLTLLPNRRLLKDRTAGKLLLNCGTGKIITLLFLVSGSRIILRMLTIALGHNKRRPVANAGRQHRLIELSSATGIPFRTLGGDEFVS